MTATTTDADEYVLIPLILLFRLWMNEHERDVKALFQPYLTPRMDPASLHAKIGPLCMAFLSGSTLRTNY
jgi:hypothetical protein